MITVGIVGGSGYGAVELIRLLQHHPEVTIKYIFSHSKADEPLRHAFPHLNHLIYQFVSIEETYIDCEVVFFATPSNVSKHIAPHFLEQGIKVIDLSGDFRLKDRHLYQQYYGQESAPQSLLNQANYSIAEWSSIKEENLIANPGCFPTATILALHPLVEEQLIDLKSIIIDAKTGVSGAGRSLMQHVHYAEMNENLSAYAIGKHKHKPEIEQYLSEIAGQHVGVTFTPHLIPMTRGILATIYVNLNKEMTVEALYNMYQDKYNNENFVRIRDIGEFPKTKEVYGSNYCDIGVYVDEMNNQAIIVTVIDNLVKGASGQAIQNLNKIFNLEQTTGLNHLPVYP